MSLQDQAYVKAERDGRQHAERHCLVLWSSGLTQGITSL